MNKEDLPYDPEHPDPFADPTSELHRFLIAMLKDASENSRKAGITPKQMVLKRIGYAIDVIEKNA